MIPKPGERWTRTDSFKIVVEIISFDMKQILVKILWCPEIPTALALEISYNFSDLWLKLPNQDKV